LKIEFIAIKQNRRKIYKDEYAIQQTQLEACVWKESLLEQDFFLSAEPQCTNLAWVSHAAKQTKWNQV
jgi:hypothetical protein